MILKFEATTIFLARDVWLVDCDQADVVFQPRGNKKIVRSMKVIYL